MIDGTVSTIIKASKTTTMKKLFYLLPLLLFACNDNTPKGKPRTLTAGKKIYVSKGGDNGSFLTGGINPGDTVVFKSSLSPFSYCYVNNIQGTKERPIVFINEGGPVRMTAGMDFHNCQYIKFSGSGTSEWYGFYINQAKNGQIGDGVGLNIAEHSAHIEAERFWVDSAQYGSWCKNEHFCDSTLVTWVLDDIHIHDFRMTHLGQHGFYYGATEPFNKTRPSLCDGVNKFYDPSRLANIKIHDGYIHDIGKNGVMVSISTTGTNEIYNMDIDSTGNQLQQDQGTGISLGYTNAYVHDNKIKNTWLWGIVAFGGSVRIENNSVDSSGWNARNKKSLNWPQNIRVAPLAVDSSTFIIKNNTLSNPGVDVPSIQFYGGPWLTNKNIICGNKNKSGSDATMKTDVGVVFKGCDVTPPPPPPAPSKQVYEKFYRVVSGKRKYYTLYTDSTWQLIK
jgi:hypothetical protein